MRIIREYLDLAFGKNRPPMQSPARRIWAIFFKLCGDTMYESEWTLKDFFCELYPSDRLFLKKAIAKKRKERQRVSLFHCPDAHITRMTRDLHKKAASCAICRRGVCGYCEARVWKTRCYLHSCFYSTNIDEWDCVFRNDFLRFDKSTQTDMNSAFHPEPGSDLIYTGEYKENEAWIAATPRVADWMKNHHWKRHPVLCSEHAGQMMAWKSRDNRGPLKTGEYYACCVYCYVRCKDK
jgi:hypothetical protein